MTPEENLKKNNIILVILQIKDLILEILN